MGLTDVWIHTSSNSLLSLGTDAWVGRHSGPRYTRPRLELCNSDHTAAVWSLARLEGALELGYAFHNVPTTPCERQFRLWGVPCTGGVLSLTKTCFMFSEFYTPRCRWFGDVLFHGPVQCSRLGQLETLVHQIGQSKCALRSLARGLTERLRFLFNASGVPSVGFTKIANVRRNDVRQQPRLDAPQSKHG